MLAKKMIKLLPIISPKASVNDMIECKLETQGHAFCWSWCLAKHLLIWLRLPEISKVVLSYP